MVYFYIYGRSSRSQGKTLLRIQALPYSAKIELNRIRTPDHESVRGNEAVDLLSRRGSSAESPLAEIKRDEVKSRICVIKMEVEEYINMQLGLHVPHRPQ